MENGERRTEGENEERSEIMTNYRMMALVIVILICSSATAQSTEQSAPPGGVRVYTLRVWHSLQGHKHNKVIHLPIGLAMAAYLLLAFRRAENDRGIRLLVSVAALGAIIACFTGVQQSMVYEGGTKEWVVELHERLGIVTAVLLQGWAATLWIRRLQRWALYAGSLAMIAVFTAGFYGGVIAHG
jgi:uncharacterized membrane protein